MTGLSLRAIDRNTGIPGFGEALVSIGWIFDHPEGIRISRFDEHNGSSAKKRCMTAKRVAKHEAANAELTHGALVNSSNCVSDALAREREREREEVNQKPHSVERALPDSPREAPTPAGEICSRLRRAGVASVNPSNPRLLALIAAGATSDEFADLAAEPCAKGKGFAWLLAAVEGRRKDAEAMGTIPQARASPSRQSGRQAAISNYAAQAAAARGDGNAAATGANERDITGEATRVA